MQTHTPLPPPDEAVNILLVDDQAANLVALEAVLDDPAWRLVRASSGEEALMALVADEFACLLLDVQMPGMSGFELARLISGRRASARTPIIFLTAHCQEDTHALEGYASGAVDYMHEPFHPDVLRHKVAIFAELHRTQRELQQRAAERDARLAEAAEEAKRRRDKFLAMLAHELRNPLAPISTAVQIIRVQADPQSRIRWACDVIGRQAGQMSRLVDDLLDVACLVEGRIALREEAVLLSTVMQRALDGCAREIEQRRQSVLLDLPAQAIEIQGDAARLVHAFSNLIANASRFSEPGAAIAIRATCGDGEVQVAVKDAGAGIAPEFLPHVFDLFAQGEQTLDRPHGGLGVGLTLVRQVIELHGGRVVARSDGPGQGTEMVVHLPDRAER
jgi:signal transduction histidine kinase